MQYPVPDSLPDADWGQWMQFGQMQFGQLKRREFITVLSGATGVAAGGARSRIDARSEKMTERMTMSEQTPRPTHDFFISRAGADAAVAREVADVLRHAGHTVRYQDEDIPADANFIERMSAFVEDCQHLVIILSPAYLRSPYCREEWTNFLPGLFSDHDGQRIAVLKVEDCAPPGILRARVYGSLVGKIDRAERRDAILAAAEGRAARIKIDPPIFENVPPRNPAFCGRDDLLAQLEANLLAVGDAGSKTVPVAIFGGPGVGKSSIAAEYAHRHAGDYWGVWWLPAQNRDALITSLCDLAERIDPTQRRDTSKLTPEPAQLERIARAVLGRLRGAPLPWLLVYDNVVNPGAVANFLPPRGVRVLITTRWPDWHGVATELKVNTFASETAEVYLLLRAGSTDSAGAARLVSAVECLPLALDHAGAFCKRTGLSFGEYSKRMGEFIRMKPAGSSYPDSVFATFSLAIDHATADCPDAERLMSLLSLLAPGTPLAVINATMDLVERTIAMEALTALSLVTLDHDRVQTHQLDQLVMRQRVHEKQGFAMLRPVLHGALTKSFTKDDRDTIFENALWVLHHDPLPQTSLQFTYMHNEDIEIEVTFIKGADGITRVFRVMNEMGRPFHRIETFYWFDGGWNSRELSNRMF